MEEPRVSDKAAGVWRVWTLVQNIDQSQGCITLNKLQQDIKFRLKIITLDFHTNSK